MEGYWVGNGVAQPGMPPPFADPTRVTFSLSHSRQPLATGFTGRVIRTPHGKHYSELQHSHIHWGAWGERHESAEGRRSWRTATNLRPPVELLQAPGRRGRGSSSAPFRSGCFYLPQYV